MSIYYIVYKTTNLVNGKIYIGVHKTSDLNDQYLGSNRILHAAIKKYGRENFSREVLCFCEDECEMYEIEQLIVDEDFVNRDDTYNIVTGGKGWSGFGKHVVENKLGIHGLTYEERSAISIQTQKNRNKEEKIKSCSAAGKIGGAIAVEKKLGIHSLTSEERKINSLKAVESQKARGIGRYNSELQRELALRPRKKHLTRNAYTDGINDFVYIVYDKTELSFIEFLKMNPQFRAGRVTKPCKDTTWVTDGIKNKRVESSKLEEFLSCNPTFVIGKTEKKRPKRVYVTNGLINKQIDENKLDEFLKNNPEFKKGLTKNKR